MNRIFHHRFCSLLLAVCTNLLEYDKARGKVVLFGGLVPAGSSQRGTWSGSARSTPVLGGARVT